MIVPLSSDAGETIRSVCLRLAKIYASRYDQDVSALCMNLATDIRPALSSASIAFLGPNEDLHLLCGMLVTAGMSSDVSSIVYGVGTDYGTTQDKIRSALEELSGGFRF